MCHRNCPRIQVGEQTMAPSATTERHEVCPRGAVFRSGEALCSRKDDASFQCVIASDWASRSTPRWRSHKGPAVTNHKAQNARCRQWQPPLANQQIVHEFGVAAQCQSVLKADFERDLHANVAHQLFVKAIVKDITHTFRSCPPTSSCCCV